MHNIFYTQPQSNLVASSSGLQIGDCCALEMGPPVQTEITIPPGGCPFLLLGTPKQRCGQALLHLSTHFLAVAAGHTTVSGRSVVMTGSPAEWIVPLTQGKASAVFYIWPVGRGLETAGKSVTSNWEGYAP